MQNHQELRYSTVCEIKSVKFKYTNYKGEISWRLVEPISIRFGSTEWHPELQWLLKAFDLEKKTEREFAMKDIQGWIVGN
ncbi:MAG: hypothetical protein PHY93_08920 [Bacteriovorax sp.]|nr:hypothetical protein [Bacteriovorax sp.]